MPLAHNPLFIAAILCLNVLICELLMRFALFRYLGTALLVIVVTALVANLGVIPAADSVVYDGVFEYVTPLAIFWLLLQVNLRDVLKAGLPMIGLFLLGCLGTILGVLAGMAVINGEETIGEDYHALGGMFVGTYTGGSLNFNTLALHYGVAEQGTLYAGAVAVDSIMTTVWMVATILIPRVFRRSRRITPDALHAAAQDRTDQQDVASDTETVSPVHISLLFAAGLFAMVFSDYVSTVLRDRMNVAVPSILVITSLALLLAQIPVVNKTKGSRLLGMFAVYIFLAVIGAYCDLAAYQQLGELGLSLVTFVLVLIAVHGLVVYGGALLTRSDLEMASIASQANIGGGTTALALARSFGRNELVLPSILVGSLGTGVGTYLGFLTAEVLL